jgi:hypothetical protein
MKLNSCQIACLRAAKLGSIAQSMEGTRAKRGFTYATATSMLIMGYLKPDVNGPKDYFGHYLNLVITESGLDALSMAEFSS